MFEPYAPHGAIQSWRGFLIHIATIVVGLIIAVGLEQTVEFFHHRQQRHYLEQQMRDVFKDDTNLVADDSEQLNALRAYLVELQTAVIARRRAHTSPAAPAGNDPRSATALRLPSLAPYEAAKDNGTVALLPDELIRLYNRVALQRSLLLTVGDQWLDDLAAMYAFKKRFDPAANTTGFSDAQSAADLATLSSAELSEYQTLIANLVNRTDYLLIRLRFFDAECRAILGGVRDENALIAAAIRMTKSGSGLKSAQGASK